MKSEAKDSGNRGWTINNGTPGFDLSSLPRCMATAKSTGKQCRNAAIKGRNFCAMHAGIYKPGRKRGSEGPRKHGMFTQDVLRNQKKAGNIISALYQTTKDLKKDYLHGADPHDNYD